MNTIGFYGEGFNFTISSAYERKILSKLIERQARARPYLIEDIKEYETLNRFIDMGVFKFLKQLATD